MTGGTNQRIKLTVTEVKERQTLPGDKGVVKLAFNAMIDGKGKALGFFTFSPSLFEAIESSVGKEIGTEVNISEKDVGDNHYVDRRVYQVYIDGKPVKVSKQGGGGYNKRDEDRTDARCAAMEIGSCWREGKLLDTDPLVADYKNWLAGAIKFKPPAPGPAPAPKPKAAVEKQPTEGEAKTLRFANAGQFTADCAKPPLKKMPSEICEALSIGKISDIKDFNKAYQDLLKIFGVA